MVFDEICFYVMKKKGKIGEKKNVKRAKNMALVIIVETSEKCKESKQKVCKLKCSTPLAQNANKKCH